MKTNVFVNGGFEVWLHALLTLALRGGEWSASCSGRFNPEGKNPPCPLDRKLGGPQIQFECGGEENKSLSAVELRSSNP
jgi:hypothetical protein